MLLGRSAALQTGTSMTSEATWAGPSPSLTILLSPMQLLSPLPYAALLNIQYLPQISPPLLPISFSVNGNLPSVSQKKKHHWAVILSHSQIHAFFTHKLFATSDNKACPCTGPILSYCFRNLALTPNPLIYSTLYWLFSFNIASMLKSVPAFKCKQIKTTSFNHTFH